MTLPRSLSVAIAVFALHVGLLFLPPIPPDIRGSLWSHLLVLVFLIASAMAVSGCYTTILSAWLANSAGRRLLIIVATLAVAGFVGVVIYSLAQPLFVRFSAEEGVWEPLSTVAYLAAGILLLKTAWRFADMVLRRHLIFYSALYFFLFLEEINYLEIFGGMLPRVDGLYLGAVHDVVNLWAKGAIPPMVLGLMTSAALLLAIALWRLKFLQPARLLRDIGVFGGACLVAGVSLIAVALGIEAHYVPWPAGVQKPEELVELTGAICLLAFALEIAAGYYRRSGNGPASG
ncbi:MAG: hypothetical protein KJO31_18635 [Gammaproteobacteria bacterium]|nr:hypothetical protein [Gammaproteobacteria bacterium]